MISLLLDLANILGGFLLALGLFYAIPNAREPVAKLAKALAPFAFVIAVVALVTGGYFLIVHLSGGVVLHYEIVGIVTGILLIWRGVQDRKVSTGSGTGSPPPADLVIAVFGVIAILVGIQGLFTPN